MKDLAVFQKKNDISKTCAEIYLILRKNKNKRLKIKPDIAGRRTGFF